MNPEEAEGRSSMTLILPDQNGTRATRPPIGFPDANFLDCLQIHVTCCDFTNRLAEHMARFAEFMSRLTVLNLGAPSLRIVMPSAKRGTPSFMLGRTTSRLGAPK